MPAVPVADGAGPSPAVSDDGAGGAPDRCSNHAPLRFADRLVGALLEAGADEEQAAWTAWTVVHFVLGLVQEEQAAPDRPDDRLTRAVDPAAHPAPHRVAAHSRPGAFEDRSAFGLDAILSRLPE